jgi:hypothetical protein
MAFGLMHSAKEAFEMPQQNIKLVYGSRSVSFFFVNSSSLKRLNTDRSCSSCQRGEPHLHVTRHTFRHPSACWVPDRHTGIFRYIYTVTRRLTTGIRSEKYVVRRFRRRANVIDCPYTNLDSTTYYKPSLYGIAYCS